MAPTLLLIQPSHYLSPDDRRLFKTKRRSVVPLTMPYLAALTPPDWTVRLIDEQLDDIDFTAPADLVGLTSWTLQSYRAYDIAAEFHRRGVPVVMGGPHVFFYAEEAQRHVDSIMIGEAEPTWRAMLADAAAGHLRPCYQAAPLETLEGLPLPRYELLDMRRFGPFRTFAMQTSRGCPYQCNFCSERLYLSGKYRWRPPEEVVEEIRRSGARSLFFGESNFAGNKARATALMEALVPLKVRWSTLWALPVCLDGKFLDLAVRAGVLHVNIGIESISTESIRDMGKKQNRAATYVRALENLRRRGITYSLNFIFGWDNESPDAFRATLDFLRVNKVPAAYFNILTPTRGTELFARMQAEGRILDEAIIDRWPGQFCHFRPLHGTPAQLEAQVQAMYREFYSLPSMLHRLPLPPHSKSDLASWVINLGERRMHHAAQANNDFDRY